MLDRLDEDERQLPVQKAQRVGEHEDYRHVPGVDAGGLFGCRSVGRRRVVGADCCHLVTLSPELADLCANIPIGFMTNKLSLVQKI